MKSMEVIQTLKSSISITKKSGIKNIKIEDLESYAEELEKTVLMTPEGVAAGEASMEAYKAELSSWITSRQQNHEKNLEMLRATITTGQSALKSAILINGGASIALLAFIGGIISQSSNGDLIKGLACGLIMFVVGVLAAAIGSGASYFSQAGYGGEFGVASRRIGVTGHVIAIIVVISSYVFFYLGADKTYDILTSVPLQ